MKFKTDENLPIEAAFLFREAGFACDTVLDENLTGASDELVAAKVRAEDRILVTLDLDFSNIQVYPPSQYTGIVVLRPKTQDKDAVLTLVLKLIHVFGERSPSGELWIVQRDRIRIRQG